jgi:hypothetical protein
MGNFRRARIGRHFNEGARLLWLRIARESLSIEDIGRVGRWARGTVHHWLYGDRRPNLSSALVLERAFGVPVTAWSKAPRRPFSLADLGKLARAA